MNRAGRYWKEWKAAKAAVDRVRELHQQERDAYGVFEGSYCHSCSGCQEPYPCPTLRALDGEQE